MSDLIAVRDQILAGTYSIWDDLDGGVVVNLTDYINVRKWIGTHWPSASGIKLLQRIRLSPNIRRRSR